MNPLQKQLLTSDFVNDSHDDDSRVNLTGANLEGANFSNSSLYQFNFTE
ncbi:MAG: pentapeptide repeat-containing protein [Okeania sp. SIO2D1]|nr:pentapeptide repeat-containing protein [Okeania sp. SIO2C9]NEQ76244.1 pentapeptide repeat-containing protein [Okeania sp. SIO2C9]NES65737.1 pentapeptide repeat-containing protein [Okeania sp. SIO2D1]